MKPTIVGLKELREHMEDYVLEVKKGKSLIVVRRSKPIFKISPPDEGGDVWETVIDFTKMRKGGIRITDLLSRL